MENQKPLWDGDTETNSELPLRRPNTKIGTSNSVSNTNGINVQDNLDLSASFSNSLNIDNNKPKCSLSVNAKEWFPKGYIKTPTPEFSYNTKSVQCRLTQYKMPAAKARDLQKLQGIINTLIEDPGEFDNVIIEFFGLFDSYYENSDAMSSMVDLIVQQAIIESNFRYNAARLCANIQEYYPLFKETLDETCKNKANETENPKYNLVLFLAELYSQLNYDIFYSNLMIQSLEQMVSFVDERGIKTVCQVMKLSGFYLEKQHFEAVDNIFQQLLALKQVPNLPSINAINNVIELRNSNWGQEQFTPSEVNHNSFYIPDTLQTEPIFYGPDGKELTEEECQFLNDNCSSHLDFIADDTDPESLWDPDPEMDEEIQVAFSEFLKLGK